MKKQSALKRLGLSLIIPSAVLAVLLLLSAVNGVRLFHDGNSWLLFIRAAATVTMTSFALSINLDSGRFDFSLGAVALLCATISGTLAVRFGLSPLPALFLSVLSGAVLGGLHSVIYVTTRIPPIIVSLGVTLFYEGTAYAFTGGKGVTVVTRGDLISFPSIINYLILTAAAVALVIILLDHSHFGAEYRALLSGQRIAVDTGIREVKNAVVCYTLSGALMGAVGFINLTNTGNVQMSLNFGSIGIMFTAFLPIFIGGWTGRFINRRLGIMLGALTMALISLAYARLNTAASVQSIVSALLLVIFLIYLNNEFAILVRLKKLFPVGRETK